MDEIQAFLKQQVAGIIDFKGQALADKYTNYVTYGGVALSVLACLITQNFDRFVEGLLATYVAQIFFCLPIPAYRRNPVTWLKPAAKTTSSTVTVELGSQ